MTPIPTLDDRQIDRLRELRAAGASPKAIARTLGVRPAAVAPWIRTIAREQDAAHPEAAVLGCWTSPGWSDHLTVHGHDDWTDDPPADASASGLAGVLVARRGRAHRVSVCGYLVDVFCLGVKDALGPRTMAEDDLLTFRRRFFATFGEAGAGIEAPLELARHLVWGAVDYADGLGFGPAPDFAAASGHLGEWAERSDITFGRDGKPFYVQGPHDDPDRVMRTLTRTVGRDDFHYLVSAGAVAAG